MLKDEIMSYKVTVLGAGLAGCEAALWLAGKGVQVTLYEQKPTHFSPAHKSAGFAELICSNSLKAERLDSASGLLKEEMRRMGSQLLEAAEEARVAAGGALAVDRDAFSAAVTRRVEECPNITVVREQVEHIDESAPILVATGPLTDGALADEIGRLTGDERLHFYDAVAPIVTAESLDYNKVFAASRYDRGEADYLNCPFNKAEYEKYYRAKKKAKMKKRIILAAKVMKYVVPVLVSTVLYNALSQRLYIERGSHEIGSEAFLVGMIGLGIFCFLSWLVGGDEY